MCDIFGQDCDELNQLDDLRHSPLLRNEVVKVGNRKLEQQHSNQVGKGRDSNSNESFDQLVHWYVKRTIETRKQESEVTQYTENEQVRYREYDLLKADIEAAIISGVAGMGKSTLLTSLKLQLKDADENVCVLLLDLSNRLIKETLQTASIQHGDLLNKICLNNPEDVLEKLIFWQFIEKKGNFVLMFDGYDRVPEHQETIIRLMKILKGKKIKQMWITTRNHDESQIKRLTTELDEPAYVLLPLTRNEQIELLFKSCEDKNAKMEQYERIGCSIDSATNTKLLSTEFMGIALHCHMFGDLFLNEQFSETPEESRILKVFEEIWNTRFDIGWSESFSGIFHSPFCEYAKKATMAKATDELKRQSLEQIFSQESERLWKDLSIIRQEFGVTSGNEIHPLVAAVFS